MSNLTLPSNFVRGYFDTLSSSWGTSFLLSAINGITNSQKIATEYLENSANLFRDIQYHNLTDIPSIRYDTLKLLFVGLEFTCAKQQRAIRATTYQVGKDWWIGGQYSINRESILSTLLDFDNFSPKKDAWWDITCEAVQALSLGLKEKGGIQNNIEITDTSLNIHFPVCPFCIDQSDNCHLFRGIMYSFLQWLYATSQCADKYDFGWLADMSHIITLKRQV